MFAILIPELMSKTDDVLKIQVIYSAFSKKHMFIKRKRYNNE